MPNKNKVISTVLDNFLTKKHPWRKGILSGEYVSNEETGEVKEHFNRFGFFVVTKLIEAHRLCVLKVNRDIASKHKALETKLIPYMKGGKVDSSIPQPEHVKVTTQELLGYRKWSDYLNEVQVILDTAIEFFGAKSESAHYDVVAKQLDDRLNGSKSRAVNTSAISRTVVVSQEEASELDDILEQGKEFYEGESDINPINQSVKHEGDKPEIN